LLKKEKWESALCRPSWKSEKLIKLLIACRKEFPFSAAGRIPAPTDETPCLTTWVIYFRPLGNVNYNESLFGREIFSHRLKDDRLPRPPDHQILEIFPALLGRYERNLLEDMGRRGLRRHKPKLQVIDKGGRSHKGRK
jgi:hypothetical protein